MRFNLNNRTRAGSLARALGVALALAMPMVACEEILRVEDPDIITPESLTGDIGLNTLYAGAIGDFTLAYSGGCCGGSFVDNVVTASGYMSDELYVSGTFPTRQEFDQRDVAIDNGTLRVWFHNLQRARRALETTAEQIRETRPDDLRISELQSLAGFTYVAFAENFCSGVPFSEAAQDGSLIFGPPQTTEAILDAAVLRFNAAISAAAGDGTLLGLAHVGLARAHLNRGDFAAAADAAAQVSDGFLYALAHSSNTPRQYNGFYSSNEWTRRSSISDNEGEFGTGLPFRSANDPRVPWEQDPRGGFDSQSPQFNLLEYGGFGIPLNRDAPLPFATHVEARLIEAEADLAMGATIGTGLSGNWLGILNELRADIGMSPLADPVTPEGRVDLLFRERAFWLFATGHRLGDMRRLIRQYDRDVDDVFPHGNFFKVGNYGPDVNFPVPEEEQNNPDFQGCLNRSA